MVDSVRGVWMSVITSVWWIMSEVAVAGHSPACEPVLLVDSVRGVWMAVITSGPSHLEERAARQTCMKF